MSFRDYLPPLILAIINAIAYIGNGTACMTNAIAYIGIITTNISIVPTDITNATCYISIATAQFSSRGVR